ncbi:hypothetical protein BKA67DRAFT_512165 [Truncatella angustata]|uniref:EKC/KEOPS complex subunit BUD32 n=1 Tax=Truncatella angustata TaxID=152316 RepID=A0A9P8UUV1_9PEZI|nr:uncharacterized protein BKA67DRAFT_512165 [Truncatella angustata]KAH6658643.1 hypothetical protein BKA67DRAFT_512165 [Truncatella angustata]
MTEQRNVIELERLLKEALERAREAEKEQQEERRRAEEAERGRQEERRRAEEAERGRQEERRHAEQAERGRQEERRRADRERQRAEASEEQTRLTTLDEYIAACHLSVFSRLAIETDPQLTSRGLITNPRDKWCPENLRPWPDFLEQQRIIFGTLYNTFPTESRVFENRNFLAGLGNRISQRPIADEKTLEYFLHNSVEDPVRAILEQLKRVEEIGSAYQIGDGIIFENHPHAISDVAEEVVARATPASPPRTPNHRRDLNQLRPDQICVYRADSSMLAPRTMVYVCEYKPPHKLTAPHFRVGLRAMNIYKEVVNRKLIPTSADPDARFQYHAERLVASAITQTYHYMMESGLEYGLLTTGETIVFLKVDWAEPQTLYYHLAEPGPEVLAHPNNANICSAVGQYLAFTLTALGAPGDRQQHGQEERRRATNGLKKWAEDFETTLRSVPENERSASSDNSSCYIPTTYGKVDHDEEAAPQPPSTPTPAGRTAEVVRRSQRLARRPRPGGSGTQEQPYCSQRCLSGLVQGGFLDLNCPNVALHRKGDTGGREHHPVDHAEWIRLLWKQLEQSLDDGITPLGNGGARSVLFRVTLLTYGYTFVSKGTVQAFVKDLENEAAVYQRLRPVQGVYVPVFLGAIDLRSMSKIYYYDCRVYVVHMTFLSWGGFGVSQSVNGGDRLKSLQDEAIRALQAIHQEGVIHQDVRMANMLFNPETNGVMLIDFERASLLTRARRPLAQLVPNKRKRGPGRTNPGKVAQTPEGGRDRGRSFVEDILTMRTVFSGSIYQRRKV